MVRGHEIRTGLAVTCAVMMAAGGVGLMQILRVERRKDIMRLLRSELAKGSKETETILLTDAGKGEKGARTILQEGVGAPVANPQAEAMDFSI